MSLGLPEFLVVLIIGVFWLVPIAAGVWALVTLHRIRSTQDEMNRRLETIEHQGQRGTTQQ
jgi:hypothetical protein